MIVVLARKRIKNSFNVSSEILGVLAFDYFNSPIIFSVGFGLLLILAVPP